MRAALITAAALALAGCTGLQDGRQIVRRCSGMASADAYMINGRLYLATWTGTPIPIAPGVPLDDVCPK